MKIGRKIGAGKKPENYIENGGGSHNGEYCGKEYSRREIDIYVRTLIDINKNIDSLYENAKRTNNFVHGLTESIHFQERVIERKIYKEDLIDCLLCPLKYFEKDVNNRKSIILIGTNVTICLNPEEKKLITVYPTKKCKFEKYKRGNENE